MRRERRLRRQTNDESEASPSTISASGSGRCRATGRATHRKGADLSIAAGTHHRRVPGRWGNGHSRTPDGTMAVGAPRAAVRHREAVVRAAADGYTLLLVTVANAFNATLYDKLNFNFIRDIAPVAGIMRVPNVMVVNPSVPAKTIPEFIAYAKANPGKINMASGGVGGPSHVSGELFNMMAGVSMVHVPYRGAGPALVDLLGGQVQVLFNSPPAPIEYIKAGALRALAVTTATRSETLPDLPTMDSLLPGYEASVWYG